jgi:hypothetical protein
MWYQHDGCAAHNTTVARNVLNRVYPGRWIGRGGPRTWPASSPDLTPLDFLWGTLKGIVYQDVPTTPENMRQRIIDGCAAMNPQEIERPRQSSSNDCNSALTLTVNTWSTFVTLSVGSKYQVIHSG